MGAPQIEDRASRPSRSAPLAGKYDMNGRVHARLENDRSVEQVPRPFALRELSDGQHHTRSRVDTVSLPKLMANPRPLRSGIPVSHLIDRERGAEEALLTYAIIAIVRLIVVTGSEESRIIAQ